MTSRVVTPFRVQGLIRVPPFGLDRGRPVLGRCYGSLS